MWTAVYVPHSFLTAGIRCSLPVCIPVCWVRDLWGVWHHLSPSSSMCCHIRADYSLPSVRSSFWPLCSVVLTFWPVQVLHLYVWIKLQVCWSLIRNMYSVCALSWYFGFFFSGSFRWRLKGSNTRQRSETCRTSCQRCTMNSIQPRNQSLMARRLPWWR